MIVKFCVGKNETLMKIAFVKPDIFICKHEAESLFIVTNSKGVVLHFGAGYMNGGIPIHQAREALANPATSEEIAEEFPEIASLMQTLKLKT